MANPRTPAQASFPIPPPVPGWPLVDAKGMATPAFAQFLQLLWAAIQGAGGIIDITTQNIFEESPSFSPDTVSGKEPIFAEMPESKAVPQDKTWLLAERSYADLYKRVSNAEVLAALGSVSSSKVADIKGTANQVIVSTAAGIYTLSTPQDIATTSTVRFGSVGVGMAPVNIVDVSQSTTGNAIISIKNANGGNAANARLLADNGTSVAQIIQLGTSFTTAGINRSDGMLVTGSGAGGITINTLAAKPIYFGINSVEKMQLDASGNLGIGMVPVNVVDITTTQTGAAKVSMLNSSNGVAAAALLRAINDAASAAIIGINSSGFTPAGMDRASGSFVVGTGVGGLSVYTLGAQPIYFGTNSVQRMQVDGTRLALSVLFQPPAYTVATLPGGSVGDIAYVTDATAPTYLGALVGGGAVKTPVFYNGAAWVSF